MTVGTLIMIVRKELAGPPPIQRSAMIVWNNLLFRSITVSFLETAYVARC